MPISSSSSRTPVAEAAGAQTQLTSVVAALLVAVMLVAAPGLLADLPTATLAAVVIAAGLSLFDFGAVVRLWRVGSAEFWLAIASFLGVAFVGVIEGVFFAVALSLLAFVRRAWAPHDAVLGRADGVKGYHDLHFYPEARQVPGLLLYRFDAPLFFANADVFRDRVRERIAVGRRVPVRWVVIAAEPITDVDTTAAEVLDRLEAELAERGHHARLRRAEGPGQGAAAPIRRARAGRRGPDLPDGRHGRQRLHPGVGRDVDGLGGGRTRLAQPPGPRR